MYAEVHADNEVDLPILRIEGQINVSKPATATAQ